MTTKKSTNDNFFWCPVCMVHSYHKNVRGKWDCLNEEHPILLRLRTDPWIEEYRATRNANQAQHKMLDERLAKYPI